MVRSSWSVVGAGGGWSGMPVNGWSGVPGMIVRGGELAVLGETDVIYKACCEIRESFSS